MRFFVGLHQPSDAQHFDSAFISVNRLRDRRGDFKVGDWIMDSGAFTEVMTHGTYRSSVREYALHIRRWKHNGNLLAAVSQDFMCEDEALKRTQLQVGDHQRLTLGRYEELLACNTGVYIIPVLQGFMANDYIAHLQAYERAGHLPQGAWVGVGSVCKRNSNPWSIYKVVSAIKEVRPDLQLHGFGVKTTALKAGFIRELFHTCDSMAWSTAARLEGRNQNDWREAKRFEAKILAGPVSPWKEAA